MQLHNGQEAELAKITQVITVAARDTAPTRMRHGSSRVCSSSVEPGPQPYKGNISDGRIH